MPANEPVTQRDFKTLVTPITTLLKFYSDGLLTTTTTPLREPRDTSALCLRFRLDCNFFQRETVLDPYIFILLKANDRSNAFVFTLEHHLQYGYGNFLSFSELVVTGSRDSPREEYVSKVAQLIRNLARSRALTERERAVMRCDWGEHQFSET